MAADLPTSGSGEFFLKNVGTGTYLKGDSYWGTKAVVWDDPYAVVLTYLRDGVYTIKSQQNNGGENQYLTNTDDPFVDGAAADMTFTEVDTENHYYKIHNGTGYLYATQITEDGATLYKVMPGDVETDYAKWQIISRPELEAALDAATSSNPVDATFFIKDAGIDVKSVNANSWSKTDVDLGGGGNAGHSAESWNKASFNLSQTITGLPNGKYRATCHGYYRWNKSGSDNNNSEAVKAHSNGDEVLNAIFFAGSKETPLMSVAGDDEATSFCSTMNWTDNTPNSQWQAAACFTKGYYLNTIDDIVVTDGTLTIGVKKETQAGTDWAVFDEFKLYYLGEDLSIYQDAYTNAKTTAGAFTESSMFASDWSTLQAAISANTLDPKNATKSELITATNALTTANTAATAAVAKKTTYTTAVSLIDGGTNVDLTSLIVNPSFESGVEGWTNSGMVTQDNSSFGKTGSKYAECWQPNGTKSLTQTIGSLPAGVYMLSLRAKTRGVTSAKIFANADEFALIIEDKEHDYNVAFEIADKASVNIGFEGVGTGAGSSWLALDNFTLKYFKTTNDLTYTLATGKMGTDKAAAQSEAETTFLAGKTIANYNALTTAIIAAETSKANYDALKAAIDKAEAVKSANNFVTAAATTAFENEISTATSAWTNVTYTDAQATAEIKTLGIAVSGWRGNATGAAGTFMTSTWGKTNDNWWDAPYINTWSTEGDNDGSGFSVPFFEYYTDSDKNLNSNTFTAQLTGLANGIYNVEVWARVQRRSTDNFDADSKITMNVNGGDAVSLMNGSKKVHEGENTEMRLGRFTATGEVTDGTLTLTVNVETGSNVHWLSWRDVKYTKVADVITITSAGYATYCSENALDFSGTGITAYTATATDKTVTFHEVEDGKIAGSNGLLLKGAKGTYQVPVTVTDNNPSNALAGVLEDTSLGAGIFVLMNGAKGVGFYKTTTTFTVGAHTAYLPASAGSRMFIGFDNEEEVTGIREVNSSANKGAIYNMNGVRVEKAKKGLYIQNGKKYVVK